MPPPKVTKPFEELNDTLTAQELVDFRAWNEIRKRKDPDFTKQELLLDDQSDIHEIVDGKKASVWVWKQLVSMAKWVGVVIGAIVAWKAFIASGGQKP